MVAERWSWMLEAVRCGRGSKSSGAKKLVEVGGRQLLAVDGESARNGCSYADDMLQAFDRQLVDTGQR